MGNRGVITLDQNPTAHSVGIYLHWNGGVESVLAFAEAAREYGVREDDYGVARLAQIIGNFFGGVNSVGVATLENLSCDNGDNGLFSVDMYNIDGVKIKHWPRGDWNKAPVEIDTQAVKAKSPYWKITEGEQTILQAVKAKNDQHFNQK